MQNFLESNEDVFSQPGYAQLASILNVLMTNFDLDQSGAILKIAEWLSQYDGFNPAAFKFLEDNNFNFNSEGEFRGDAINETLMGYACEFRDDKLASELMLRDVIPNNHNIVSLVVGHSYGDEKLDFSEMLSLLLKSKGNFDFVEIKHEIEEQIGNVCFHENVANIFKQYGFIVEICDDDYEEEEDDDEEDTEDDEEEDDDDDDYE
jgi:hypothetical protein